MKLPHHELALVPREKMLDYLLSLTHSQGRHKAAFFASFGFSTDNWEVLADSLKRHVADHPVTKVENTPFGTRYVVEGIEWKRRMEDFPAFGRSGSWRKAKRVQGLLRRTP